MYGLARGVAESGEFQLAVATVYPRGDFASLDASGVRYYMLPKNVERHWRKICDEFKPGLVHVHGTEYPYGLACMRANPQLPYVVSLQGLTSVYARYHYGGMTARSILRHLTLRDILKRDTMFQSRRRRETNGMAERECLRKATIVAGRTSWDRLHAEVIAPEASYRTCNESLRDAFYVSNKWDITSKQDHALFMSQAHTPVKGMHQALRALALLKDEYPAIRLRIAGNDIVATSRPIHRLKRTGYGYYIRRLIAALDLESRVSFLGRLSEDHMIAEYRNAHVFLCPSAVENSPNSVGEAQLLGVPVVASCAGGTPDMIENGRTGLLYRFEEFEMLAASIKRLFQNDALAKTLSRNGIETATVRHDRTSNLNQILDVYRSVRTR
jgi:glycosyltransferase involved in cell wall biosynthesis